MKTWFTLLFAIRSIEAWSLRVCCFNSIFSCLGSRSMVLNIFKELIFADVNLGADIIVKVVLYSRIIRNKRGIKLTTVLKMMLARLTGTCIWHIRLLPISWMCDYVVIDFFFLICLKNEFCFDGFVELLNHVISV